MYDTPLPGIVVGLKGPFWRKVINYEKFIEII